PLLLGVRRETHRSRLRTPIRADRRRLLTVLGGVKRTRGSPSPVERTLHRAGRLTALLFPHLVSPLLALLCFHVCSCTQSDWLPPAATGESPRDLSAVRSRRAQDR